PELDRGLVAGQVVNAVGAEREVMLECGSVVWRKLSIQVSHDEVRELTAGHEGRIHHFPPCGRRSDGSAAVRPGRAPTPSRGRHPKLRIVPVIRPLDAAAKPRFRGLSL